MGYRQLMGCAPVGSCCPGLGSWGNPYQLGLAGLGADASLAVMEQKRSELKTAIEKNMRDRAILAEKLKSFKVPIINTQIIPQEIIDFIAGKSGTQLKMPDFLKSAVSALPGGADLLKQVESVISEFNRLTSALNEIEKAISSYAGAKAPATTTKMTALERQFFLPSTLPGLAPNRLKPGQLAPTVIPKDINLQPARTKPTKKVPTWAWPVGVVALIGGGLAYKTFKG